MQSSFTAFLATLVNFSLMKGGASLVCYNTGYADKPCRSITNKAEFLKCWKSNPVEGRKSLCHENYTQCMKNTLILKSKTEMVTATCELPTKGICLRFKAELDLSFEDFIEGPTHCEFCGTDMCNKPVQLHMNRRHEAKPKSRNYVIQSAPAAAGILIFVVLTSFLF